MEPPFLFADASAGTGSNPPWSVLVDDPRFAGIILKATEGLTYDGGGWFARHWPKVRDVASSRYGDTWFRGAYHYIRANDDGAKQADFFLRTVEKAGGWDHGDILPLVDFETAHNEGITAEHFGDVLRAFVTRVKLVTGRDVIKYSRGLQRDLGAAGDFGTVGDWNPSYTRTMVTNGIGSVDRVVLWQYAGDGQGDDSVHGLPITIDGFPTNIDFSVYVDGARKPTLDSLKRRLLGRPNWPLLFALVLGALALTRFRLV